MSFEKFVCDELRDLTNDSLKDNVYSSLSKIIEQKILNIKNNICLKYNLNIVELNKIFNNNSVSLVSNNDINNKLKNDYSKMTKKELVDLCKSKKLTVSGTKDELIKKIIEFETKSKNEKIPITNKLFENKLFINISRNKFGNFEHKETKLLINKDTECIYGKQCDDGKVNELTPEDIEICKSFNFKYKIPENLNNYLNTHELKEDIDLSDSDDNLEEEIEEEIEISEYEEELEEEEEDFNDELEE
jgi:hypothetical protein